jgi:hypothetical protein
MSSRKKKAPASAPPAPKPSGAKSARVKRARAAPKSLAVELAAAAADAKVDRHLEKTQAASLRTKYEKYDDDLLYYGGLDC